MNFEASRGSEFSYFKRPSVLRRRAYYEPVEGRVVGENDKECLDQVIDVLNHPITRGLIEKGCITLGAIKPNAHESKLGLDDDVLAEEAIIKHIGIIENTELKVMFAVSLSPSKA